MKLVPVLAALGLGFLSSMTAWAYDRVVVLSGDVGDVVVALGAAQKVVGRDDANKNPTLKHAKEIGIHRNLTVEPIVAVRPDLVLGSYMVQPTSIYSKLNSLGIKAVNVAPQETAESYAASISSIGRFLGKSAEASRLSSQWNAGMKPKAATKTRYILSYDGRLVAGRGTVGDDLIRRAGGINAANVNGLKPLSREGWLAAKADVIIVAEHNKPTLGSLEQFKKRPEIMGNPAAKTGKVYYWPANDFLRYGLDSPQVVDRLHRLAK